MFLPLLCLSTILALTCAASCQPSCSPPPSSGSVRMTWFRPFSRSMMAPTRSCAAAPAPSPSESAHRTRWLPSASLRHAWPRMPCLTARVAAADRRTCGLAATKRVLFSDLLVSSSAPPRGGPGQFSYPARRFLHARDQWCLHSLHRRGTHPVSGHHPRGWTYDLFSSQPRPELGGSPVES